MAELPGRIRGDLGEPIERDGVTLIPVYSRRGAVRGAYVIGNGKARWEPTFNLNRTILVGNISWWVMAILAWWIVRGRRGGAGKSEDGR